LECPLANPLGIKRWFDFYNEKNSVKQVIRLTIAKDNEVNTSNFNYEGKVDK